MAIETTFVRQRSAGLGLRAKQQDPRRRPRLSSSFPVAEPRAEERLRSEAQGPDRISAGLSVLRPARRTVRPAAPPAGLTRAVDEIEKRLADLVSVGPDDRVRPARDDGGTVVLQQLRKPPAGGLVGQDAVLVSVDDQDRDADRGEIASEVFQAGCDAAESGLGRRGNGNVEAVLPCLVADPAAAKEIDVVGAVQE